MPAVDTYAGMGGDLAGPSSDGFAIVPSDTVDLPFVTKRIWVGGAGAVSFISSRGTTLTYLAVPAGTYLNVRASRVRVTGTSASNMIGEI